MQVYNYFKIKQSKQTEPPSQAQPSQPRKRSTPHTCALHTPSPAQVRRGDGEQQGRARAVLKPPPRRVSGKSRLRSLGFCPPRAPHSVAGDSAALAPARCRLFRQLERFLLSSPATAPRPGLQSPLGVPSSPLVGRVLPPGLRPSARRREVANRSGVRVWPPPPALPPPGLW